MLHACALVMLLLSGSAFAQWTMLGRNDRFRIYMDPRAMQRKGDFAQTWQLVDFTSAQWADERTLAIEAYSEQMGDGRVVASEQKADAGWEAIEPGASAEKVRLLACDAKSK